MNQTYQNMASAQPRLITETAEVQSKSEEKDVHNKISQTIDAAIQHTRCILLDVPIRYRESEPPWACGFSLCPQYSVRQLRKINHLLKRKYGRAYLKSSQLRSTIGFPVHRQLSIKQAFNGGIKI